jgi:hypothetical protein
MRITTLQVALWRAGVAVLVLGLLLGVAGRTQAGFLNPLDSPTELITTVTVTATNNTGVTINDFNLIFLPVVAPPLELGLNFNAPGAGPATITSSLSMPYELQIDLTWDAPGLPDGGTFQFHFDLLGGSPSYLLGSGTWTRTGAADIPLDIVRDNFQTVATFVAIPEPSSLVMGATAALAGLGYAWSRHGNKR